MKYNDRNDRVFRDRKISSCFTEPDRLLLTEMKSPVTMEAARKSVRMNMNFADSYEQRARQYGAITRKRAKDRYAITESP